MYSKFFKRLFDLLLALVLLILLSPVLLLVAIAVRLDSAGPVVFAQDRLTLNGKVFKMYKFRSMIVNAENIGSGVSSFKGDKRITKVGRILRKTSLDELPQLVNIIKGEMSFIGPRPVLTYHPCTYQEYTEAEKTVFHVRPGITGWAQVNGRNTVDWINRFELNMWYVKNVSFMLDLKIVFMTIGLVSSRKDTVISKDVAKSFKERKAAEKTTGENYES